MTGEKSVPNQIRETIEASEYPELTVREVTQRTGLTEQQVYSTAGSMDQLELDRRVGVMRLPGDDGGEFVDDHEYELLTDGGTTGPDEANSRRNCPACGEADAPVERLGQRIREDNVMVVGWRCLSCETEVSELIGNGEVSDMLAEDPRVGGAESSTALDEPPETPDPPMYPEWEGVETWSKANLRYPVPGGWTIDDHGKFHTTWKHDDGTELTRSSKRTPGSKDTFVFRVDGDEIYSVDTGPKRVEMREETVWLLQFYDEHGIESVDEFRLEVRKQRNQSLADFSGGVSDA